jgi:excisionase family DNA binding protein
MFTILLILAALRRVLTLFGLCSIDATSATPAERFCTVRDAQALLHLSKPTIHRLIASGELAGVKVGRRRLIVRNSLDVLADRLAAGEDITTHS